MNFEEIMTEKLKDLQRENEQLKDSLREAAGLFANATKYNHREWHLEHEDLEPKDCPDCQFRQSFLDKWAKQTS